MFARQLQPPSAVHAAEVALAGQLGCVPEHVVAPCVHAHPLSAVQAACVTWVLHAAAVPEHVPPTPASFALHAQPAATQGA